MNPQQVEQIIRDALGATAQQYIFLAVALSAAVALIASYLGSYLQTKGSHRALREDLKTLTEKVAATTRAAEEIRARISQTTWVEQRQWELKRELYTDLLKAVYRALNLTSKITDLYVIEGTNKPSDWTEKAKKRREALEPELEPLWDEIARVRGIGELILSAETIKALDSFHKARTDDFQSYIEELEGVVAAAKKAHVDLVVSAKSDLDIAKEKK